MILLSCAPQAWRRVLEASAANSTAISAQAPGERQRASDT